MRTRAAAFAVSKTSSMPSPHPCRRPPWTRLLCLTLVLSAAGFAAPGRAADATPATPRPAPGAAPRPAPGPAPREQSGLASITRDRLEGFATASGEPYRRNALTAGHRSLPFGTLVRVTNLDNNKNVVVRINDRNSAVGARILELTPHAAAVIGLQGIGSVQVKLEVIGASGAPLTPPIDDSKMK